MAGKLLGYTAAATQPVEKPKSHLFPTIEDAWDFIDQNCVRPLGFKPFPIYEE